MALRPGVWIKGRVSNAKTGEPVIASVDYFPFLTNEHAKIDPNFRADVTSIAVKTWYRTGQDGRFRVVGLPGRGVVTARSDDRAFRTGIGVESIVGKVDASHLPTFDQIPASSPRPAR